jgi:ubiquinol-cytochrome c reductase iron-sulfur subunit
MRLSARVAILGLHDRSKGANRTPLERAACRLSPGPAAAGSSAAGGERPLASRSAARADRPARKDSIVTATSSAEPTRRDFLYIATATAGAAAVAASVWPLVAQMNPDQSTIAAGAPLEVDLAPIAEGQVIKVFWRGKPIFLSHRSQKEIKEARSVDWHSLPDPQSDEARVKEGHDQWLVVIGICTHLGCIPLAHQGEYDGWFCPCHGSQYDTSARIRRGPAPANLPLPPYAFLSDTKIRIG